MYVIVSCCCHYKYCKVCCCMPLTACHFNLTSFTPVLNKNQSLLDTSVTPLPKIGPNDGPCSRVRNYEEPCSCRYDFCMGWYPCGLKYCRGKDSTNKVVNYRCGIKTCSKCRSFEFLVPRHFLCVWNDDVMSFNATEDSFYGGGVWQFRLTQEWYGV